MNKDWTDKSKGMNDLADRIAGLSPAKRALMELRLKKKEPVVSAEQRIPLRENRSSAPLSFAQQRLWFLNQMGTGSAYNLPLAIRLKGVPNIKALEESLTEIIRRHEALRTTFRSDAGDPVQIIAENISLEMPLIDLSGRPKADRAVEAERLTRDEAMRHFDLVKGPLFNAVLIRLSEAEHILLLTMHHIVSDAWSLGVFTAELAALYKAYCNGESSPLSELPIQYADFAHWQREWLQGEVLENQLSYWRKQLEGVPVLQLFTDRPRPAVQTFAGASQNIAFSPTLTSALNDLSQRQGVTLFMTLLAAFQVLLFRYTGQEDIVVGSPIANRNRTEIEGLIGFFVNTLAMRTDLSGNPSFLELLGRVREIALEAYAHQDLPFEKLVEELHPERDMSRHPLFQIMFAIQNMPAEKRQLPGLTLSSVAIERITVRFDIEIFLWEKPEGLSGRVVYNTDLFDDATIARLMGHYETLLESIVADPQQRVSDVQILTEAERRQLLVDWNDTKKNYPDDRCVHQLFEQQVEQSPDAVAVVYGDEQLTYRQLNTRANQLAHYLKGFGVGPEVLVGICLERSLEMIIAVLGILKAGGAYVPLDPEYPKKRLTFMLADTQTPVLLTQQKLLGGLPETAARVVCLDSHWEAIGQESPENPISDAVAENLAYVMYTSGSTGRPKGVCVTHRNVVRLVKATNYASLGAEEVFLQFAPISFDASTLELWGPLLNGGRLVVFPAAMPSLAQLGEVIEQHQVTILWLTAGLFHQMVEDHLDSLGSVRQLLAGGDVLSVPHVKRVLEQLDGRCLINGYGPTENTTFTTCYPMTDVSALGSAVPIGRPIANTRVYILDAQLQPVPIGVAGELYTGGDGLARGYLNRPELTAEKFIPDPFSEDPAARLYKTGDLARYLPDGSIEFLGRIDDQVKIRGFRIELGEVESVLGRHPAVEEAVVIAREDVPGDKRLVAYVVPSNEPTPTFSELRSFLKEKLPDYMIPSALVFLDIFPLTPNGKVDRRALPAPEQSRSELENKFVAPRTSLEEAVAGIWCEELGLEKVGMRDNFFDLGGHSLLIMRIHRKLQKITGDEIPIITLFQYPTIGSLCRYLRREATERTSFAQIHDRAERQMEAIHQRDIAIIGMSGRFPKAKNLDQFWHNLREGRECISFFSDEDLHSSGVNPALINNPDYVRASAVLEEIELFDASFFGINPREAEIIDPQQRLFLECAWEAFEDSGYDTENYDGLIGVYAGSTGSSYLQSNLLPNQRLMEIMSGLQVRIGNDKDFISTRVSYKLNLKGPSVAVQTACSTSLVAVVFACQNLLSYQCDIALAGGVSIKNPQKRGYLYQSGMIGSPDGHCRAFDARAQGTVSGNGIGIVILKRLADAIADGDRIRAVIKGYAVNNDGAEKVGYTAPAVDGQADVIAMAQAMARVKPETVSYVEAHGTGTPLGDPIELAALTKAFRADTDRKGFCAIGSVKTNIGHLDAAAGVAGLIKTVLVLENKLLPPSLHFVEPNPEIDFENSPFYVNTKLSEWTADEGPRRAGVSSFGIGGSNAHVIVEEPPPHQTSGPPRPRQLLLLSAKTETALETATNNLVAHLKNQPDLNLADAAYTLQVGRREFSNRRVVVCQNIDEAVNALDTADPKRVFTAHADMDDRPVVFMFSGQGSQYVNMGLELYRVEASFREQIDLCAEILKPHLGLDLREVLYPDEKRIDEATRRLTQTSMTQPALFAIEYALAKLLAEWGIRPRAMIGHSIGEYVAACVAGVFSLEDALELVAMRGRLIQELPGGAMLAVALGEKEIRGLIGIQLSLAAVNGTSGCVVSGTEKNVAAFQSELAVEKVPCRRLHTSHAFHSEMMEPILPQFTQFLAKINLNPPDMRYISNVTGTWVTTAEATDPTYWARHLRHTVCFADGIAELLKMPDAILLEIGPGRTLATLAKQQVKRTSDRPVLSSLPHPQEPEPDLAFLLRTLGRLWLKGVKVDWTAFSGNERRKRISLPTYPFERQRYWVDPIKPTADEASRRVPLSKKPHIAEWFYVPSWNRTPPPELLKDGALAAQQVTWLVFVDRCGLGDKMAKRMERAGQDVIRVKPGERFEGISEGVFTVNPESGGDYGALLLELKRLNKVPDRIVHLWGVTANEQQQEIYELVKRFQYSGFYSLLFLAQALGATNPADAVMIDVVTNNIHNVNGEEVLCPAKAMVLAPCRVIPQEFPNLKCRTIDITFPAPGNKQEEILINQIMAELTIKPSGQSVAYRGRHRWLQTYEAVKPDESPEETPRILRNGGIYLITGGLGGIGLVLSEYLARTVRAKLVLTGRSAFPAKNEWNQWLETHDTNDSVSRKIRKVQTLEDLGAEVVVCRADTANLKQMQHVINETYERFGNLHGVVHAAGIVAGNTFQEIRNADQDTCKQQFQPKVNGLIVLEKVLQGRKCDFCLLTSSLSSVLGGLSFASYSAGNIFMDAFAQKHSQFSPVPWISVNWDAWQFENKAGRRSGFGASLAELAINPEEGKEVFRRIFSMTSLPQLVISTGKLQNRIEQWVALEASPDTKSSKNRELSSKHVRPEVSTANVAPRDENEQAVAEIWQELLGIQRIGIYDNYFELGGDSLLATQIIYRMREKFKVDISLDNFFQAQTIEQLTRIIHQGKVTTPWSSLVPIQPGGTRPPFFCTHGCTGRVLHFYNLARHLGPDQPFYGLFAQGRENEQDPHKHIEEMAAHYIKEIRTIQSYGPYFIGGSGDGCPIALEMAHQLESQGQNLELIALLTPPSLKPNISTTNRYTYGRYLRIFFRDLIFLLKKRPLIPAINNAFSNHEFSKRVLWHFRIFHRFIPIEIHRQRRFIKSFREARFRYTPKTYHGRITCFLRDELSLNYKNKIIDDWYELAGGGLDIRFVPGTIFTMWHEPNVQILAEKLTACLNEAQKNS